MEDDIVQDEVHPIREAMVNEAVRGFYRLLLALNCSPAESISAAYVVVSQMNRNVIQNDPTQQAGLVRAMSRLILELTPPQVM